MASEVKRWGFTPGFCDEPGEFEETSDGPYVRYEDHLAELERQLSDLRLVCETQKAALDEEKAICKSTIESIALMAGMNPSEEWGVLDILTHIREMRESLPTAPKEA